MQVKPDILKVNHAPLQVALFSWLGAIILTLGLFLLVPITQWVDSPEYDKKIITMRTPMHLPPPTPPPKTLPKVEKIKQASLQKPKLNQSTKTAQLNNLNVDLSIGMGVALNVEGGLGSFETEVDVVQQVKELFTFDDLSTPPRYLSVPKLNYPKDLVRRGIKSGKVVLLIEIDEKGSASVLKVVSSTNPRLESEAVRLVGRSKFTIPMVNGKPTKVQGEWPLILRAP